MEGKRAITFLTEGIWPVSETFVFFYDFQSAKEYLEKKGYEIDWHGCEVRMGHLIRETNRHRIHELEMMAQIGGLTPKLENELKNLTSGDKYYAIFRVSVNSQLKELNPEIATNLKKYFSECYPSYGLNLLGENEIIVFAERFKDELGGHVPDLNHLFQRGD